MPKNLIREIEQVSAATADDSLDLEESAAGFSRGEATRFTMAALLPLLVTAIATASGFAPLIPGGRGWTSLLLFPMYLGVSQAALLWPLKHSRWLPTQEQPERFLVALVISSIPLLSFAYFLGNFRDLSQGWDAFLAVIPPLAIGWLAFRKTGSELWFALLTGGTSFLSLFVFNDAFGPFRTVLACAPYGQLFHSLRTLAAFGGIAMAVDASLTTLTSQRRALVLLAAASIAVDFILPRALFGFGIEEVPTPTYAWIGFITALYFLYRRTEFAKKAFIAIACLQAFVIMFRIGIHIGAPSSALGVQAQLALEALSFGYFASVAARALPRRGFFRFQSPAEA